MSALALEWTDMTGQHHQVVDLQNPVIVGRKSICAVRVASDAVSRLHAEMRRRGDGICLVDLTGGRNSTLINGRSATPENRLQTGDALRLGDITLRVTRVDGIACAGAGPWMEMRWRIAGRAYHERIVAGNAVSLGRDRRCTIVLPPPTVSREHAAIEQEGGRFIIRDLTGGINPVYVGGMPCRPTRVLNVGDEVHLGTVTVTVTAMQGCVTPGSGVTELHGRCVLCPTCSRRIPDHHMDCRYCGTALVNGETVI